MKITKRQLRRIVKEEKAKLLERGGLGKWGPDDYAQYQITPEQYIGAAEDLLTSEELQSIGQQKLETLAIDLADELAYRLEDSLEGFGSSDRTYEFQAYLEQLGFKTGFPSGTLEIIREGKMRIKKVTKRQLKKIIEEEKRHLIREQDDATPIADNNTHHWPRVAWDDVGELVDKWADGERKAFDKGDPSMMAMGETATEAKGVWDMQVEQAGMEMEAELTDRVRKVALQTMQEFTNALINGDYA